MILQIKHPILHGKYVIERFVGKGGFGEVYQARNTRLNSVVAVKVIAPGHGSSAPDFERARLRFETEAQVGAQISHENVIKVYDLDFEGDTWFLISEFAAGGSLKDRLARGALPAAEALAVGVQVCRGAAALHRSGYVHRDIKPSNILFDEAGRARLADLGLVQTGASIEREVGMGGYQPGTLQYMSPEQETSRGYLRPASDVYSIGCVLFEMLTGKVYKSLPPGTSLRSLNPQASPQLDAIIAKALAIEIELRYEEGDAFTQALEEGVLKSSKNTPPSPVESEISNSQADENVPSPDFPEPSKFIPLFEPAVIDPENVKRLIELLSIEKGGENQVDWSPDGSLMAAAGSTGIHLYNTLDFAEMYYIETSYGVESIAFSPSADKFACGSEDGTLSLWNTVTSELFYAIQSLRGCVWSVVSSPDGQRLASGESDGTVRIWKASSGKLLRTLTGHSKEVNSLAFSPDGRMLASGSQDNTVHLWDSISGQKLHTFEDHSGPVLSVAFTPDGTRLASGSWDKTVQVWEPTSGRLLHTLEGHAACVNSVSFSPDGRLLVSGGDDGFVIVWDTAGGAILHKLDLPVEFISSAAFSPDGRILASSSEDGAIRLWGASER